MTPHVITTAEAGRATYAPPAVTEYRPAPVAESQRIEIIDVSGKVDYCDYVVVMSAGSDRQANAIAKNVDAEMAKRGIKANSVEGLPQGSWVLMDFGDVVVHIFHQDTRGYYDLESLWFDAARVEVKDNPKA